MKTIRDIVIALGRKGINRSKVNVLEKIKRSGIPYKKINGVYYAEFDQAIKLFEPKENKRLPDVDMDLVRRMLYGPYKKEWYNEHGIV